MRATIVVDGAAPVTSSRVGISGLKGIAFAAGTLDQTFDGGGGKSKGKGPVVMAFFEMVLLIAKRLCEIEVVAFTIIEALAAMTCRIFVVSDLHVATAGEINVDLAFGEVLLWIQIDSARDRVPGAVDSALRLI